MKSIGHIASPVLLSIATLVLSACGGGGSSGIASSTSTSTSTSTSVSNTTAAVVRMTGVNGFKVNYTPNFTSPSGWTGAITSPVTYSSSTSINSFAVADGASPAHTFSQTSASSLSAGTFATVGSTNLGGTTYSYSRFGWLAGPVTETDGSTTYWYTPFALASSEPTTPNNATYAGTKQALVYLEGDKVGSLAGPSGYAECDISASYTTINKSLQLSFSNCNTAVGFTISGALTLMSGTGTTTLAGQSVSSSLGQPRTMISTTVDSGNFLLAGPNGEELVGAATIKGSISQAGSIGSNPAIFFVIFGGKKQ